MGDAATLKLPRGAWQRAALTERLAREREILATLDHPNIARLYDAGVADDGQPYIALEYVEGERIDAYCARKQLDVPARLRLFLQVVHAVAHAHANLVVHRDLEQANVLVTDDGTARLLDFGIAKLLEDGIARETELTQLTGRAMTPDYAAPEQILRSIERLRPQGRARIARRRDRHPSAPAAGVLDGLDAALRRADGVDRAAAPAVHPLG